MNASEQLVLAWCRNPHRVFPTGVKAPFRPCPCMRIRHDGSFAILDPANSELKPGSKWDTQPIVYAAGKDWDEVAAKLGLGLNSPPKLP
jgi:hypothetical protein